MALLLVGILGPVQAQQDGATGAQPAGTEASAARAPSNDPPPPPRKPALPGQVTADARNEAESATAETAPADGGEAVAADADDAAADEQATEVVENADSEASVAEEPQETAEAPGAAERETATPEAPGAVARPQRKPRPPTVARSSMSADTEVSATRPAESKPAETQPSETQIAANPLLTRVPVRAITPTWRGVKLFEAMDTDGDGQIDWDEMEADRKRRFSVIDRDDDGTLPQEEFVNRPGLGDGVVREMILKRRQTLFRNMDADKDGFVTEAEYIKGGRGVFARIDRDGDDRISSAEFSPAD